MLTTIVLYGRLGKGWGKKWRLDVETPAEAVNAINCLRPGFHDAILAMGDCDFGVTVGGEQISEDFLVFPNQGRTITITPVVRGSANSKGWIQIVAGAVLIIAGIVLAGTPLGVASPYLISAGISLVIGGVAQLLSPTPTTNTDTSNKTKPSYQFSNVVNTIGQGECVPALYGGPKWIGSAVVSAGYENVDITQGSNTTSPNSNQGSGSAALPMVVNRDEP